MTPHRHLQNGVVLVAHVAEADDVLPALALVSPIKGCDFTMHRVKLGPRILVCHLPLAHERRILGSHGTVPAVALQHPLSSHLIKNLHGIDHLDRPTSSSSWFGEELLAVRCKRADTSLDPVSPGVRHDDAMTAERAGSSEISEESQLPVSQKRTLFWGQFKIWKSPFVQVLILLDSLILLGSNPHLHVLTAFSLLDNGNLAR
mmetsp:Transcript_75296/g.135641  ORF Transcript_75296/g.135641 Transcript_75296/m.135641 type:complete len:203 (-) Transcript_75296:684-1292(-)